MTQAGTLGSAYLLHERVGRGAMGEVWRGSRRLDGDEVAIKVLHQQFTADPDIVARFLRERSILMGLDHPNIVRLRDLVAEGDTLALVMDFVEGGDLGRLLAASPTATLPPSEAAGLMAQVLDGLGAAHGNGVVHRDLKPHNILVDRSEQDRLVARVTDFGIAWLSHGPALTQMSIVVGTPEYLAPELSEGSEPTPTADLYSAGIVLYELVAGRTPFAGGPPVRVLRRHLEETPPKVPGLAPQLWAVIAELLDKDPSRRPPSAHEVAEHLRQIAPELEGHPPLPLMSGQDRTRNRAAQQPSAAGHRTDDPEQPPAGAASGRTGGSLRQWSTPPERPLPPTGPPEQPTALGIRHAQTGLDVTPAARSWRSVFSIVHHKAARPTLLALALLVLPFAFFVLTARVPNLQGLGEAKAVAQLRQAGFGPRIERRPSPSVAAGTVMSSEPHAGSRAIKRSRVGVVVSSGVRLVSVPDVIGRDRPEARNLIRTAGFDVQEERVPSEDPVGTIVSTVPPVGTQTVMGSPVKILISSGPTALPKVPNCDRFSVGDCEATLRGEGFVPHRVSERSSEVDAGKVIRTFPEANAEAEKGSRVTMYVSSGTGPGSASEQGSQPGAASGPSSAPGPSSVPGPTAPAGVPPAAAVERLFSGGRGVIYGITGAGELRWYRHTDPQGGAATYAAGGKRLGQGWAVYKQVFSGGDGVIYAINSAGKLFWYRHNDPMGGSPGFANAGQGKQIGAGWGIFSQVFSGGDGVIYAVTGAGELRWYRHTDLQGGAATYAPGSGKVIGRGWAVYKKVFSGSNGVIYAINSAGKLFWYRHNDPMGGSPGFANAGQGKQIGAGWGIFSQVFSGGDGVIYAVTGAGELRWYRHTDLQGGAATYAPGSGKVIGSGR